MKCIECENLVGFANFSMCKINQKKIKRKDALKENNCKLK